MWYVVPGMESHVALNPLTWPLSMDLVPLFLIHEQPHFSLIRWFLDSMLMSFFHSVLYTGVTSDLKNRLKQHKEKNHRNSFTALYNLSKLVYYEAFESIVEAIRREKQIKAGTYLLPQISKLFTAYVR